MNKQKFYQSIEEIAQRAAAIKEYKIAMEARKVISWDGTIDEVKTQRRADAIVEEFEKKIAIRERRISEQRDEC